MYNIDLKKLAARESEKVEWKENGDDKEIVKNIVKTISAFANDLANMGGGYVVCGAKEITDEFGFQKLRYTGLSAEKLKKIEGQVLQHCRDYVCPSIAPLVQIVDNPEDEATKILVFIIHASAAAHTYRNGATVNYYVRIGRATREARNGILSQLLTSKQAILPFDRRPNPNVNENDIDTFLFRDCINAMNLSRQVIRLEDYLSDTEQIAEFVPPLLVKKPLDGGLCLRNFALFLFGKKESISRYFPDIYTVVSIYNGVSRSEPTAERFMLNGSIIEQARRAIELLSIQANNTLFDKTSKKPNQQKYPLRAIQEAVVNAIVHRDYEKYEPIRITVFRNRIEIMSPGTLHWGVDKEKFLAGKASPKWRNQSFAYLFNKLNLAQAEGQGLDTIFRTMQAEGCPDPLLEVSEDNIICILPASDRYEEEIDANINTQDNTQDNTTVSTQDNTQVSTQDTVPDNTTEDTTDNTTDNTIDNTQVSTQDNKILLLLNSSELSTNEIKKLLYLKDKINVIKNYIQPAIRAGLIEMTIPDKPNSKYQKYRLTTKGKELKNKLIN
ncbi:MAG: putative DNA binding domain-containing protein [Prevotellaceae bacterium]|nr:putative DNA binding domain-containing protein [Prevotellaceae bacterium]